MCELQKAEVTQMNSNQINCGKNTTENNADFSNQRLCNNFGLVSQHRPVAASSSSS